MTSKSIDISPHNLNIVRSILHSHVPGHEIWAFGSRARWTSQDYSDLDLAIRSVSPIPTSILSALREDFSESDLPMKVDVLDMASVSENFRKVIEEEYLVIQEKGIPSDWKDTRLADVAGISTGKSNREDAVEDGLYAFFDRSRNIKKSTRYLFDCEAVIVPGEGKEFIPRYFVGKFDLHQRAYAITNFQGVCGRFIYYAITNQREYFERVAVGSTVKSLRLNMFRDFPLLLPPLGEQKEIANILGALDDKIEISRKVNATLETIAQALFQSWFVDFDPVHAKSKGRNPGLPPHIAALFPSQFEDSSLGPIPKGWEISSLSDICSLNPLRSLRQGEIAPYLDMKNMPTIGPCPNEVVNRKFTSGSRFENGDTLLARITPCLENGKTAYVQHLADHQVGWGSTEFIVLRPHSPIPPVFAYYLARSDSFRSFAIQRMTGSSGRQRVDSSSLSGFNLAIPPDEIFIEFGKLLSPAMAHAHANAQNSRHLSQIRDSLLPKLLSGELHTKV